MSDAIRPDARSPAEKLAAAKPRRVKPPALRCTLRAARGGLGLTATEVAVAVGLSRVGYWRIERGCDLRLTTARRIAEFYGLPINTLWPERA